MINYKSELINKILEQRGHEKSSLHYESECIEAWINETKGAYPKLTDYESEWLNYIVENPIGEFPYETIIDVTDATVDNVVPYAYKSAIFKGSSMVNLSTLKGEIVITPGAAQFSDSLIKDTTTYTVSFNCSSVPSTGSIEVRQVKGSTAVKMENKSVVQGYNQFILKSSSSGAERIRFKNDSASTTDFIFNDLMILEGDYTNVVIPYFEDMKSVQMPVLRTSNEDGTITNILTVNEDVELGSVGEVKDELNLLTGQLTQRTKTRAYQEGDESNSEVITDMTNTRYKLSKEVIITVDLSVVDEKGNKINHFIPIEGTMHIQTDGVPIKPTVTMEIPVEAITQNLTSFIEEE